MESGGCKTLPTQDDGDTAMNKPVLLFLFLATALLGCNSSTDAQTQTPADNESAPSADEALTLSVKDLIVTVDHKNMEISDECPRVTLSDGQNETIDQKTLCEVNIEGYPTFDAREDFAFISFENYRVDGDSLLYNIDLAIRQGASFIAECRLPVADGQLGSPKCRK